MSFLTRSRQESVSTVNTTVNSFATITPTSTLVSVTSIDYHSEKEGKDFESHSAEHLYYQGADLEEVEWTYDDQGMRGYLVVIGCFLLAATGIGYCFLFGAWLQDLHVNTYPDVPLSTLNMISGVSNCLMTITAFISGRLADVYGYKPIIAVGCVAMGLSLLASAFTFQSLPAIFITQGACVGISQGIGMPIYLSLPSQWYKKHRGLATGIAASGSGIGGGMAALLVRTLLPRLGYRNTMLVYTGISVVVWMVAFLLIETRLPPLKVGETRTTRAWLPSGVWNDLAFYSFIGAMFISLFGYLPAFYYITPYVASLDPSKALSSIDTIIPLVVMNVCGGFGRIFAGVLADIIGPINALTVSFLCGGLFQLIIWPLAKTYASATVFAASYGFFGIWVISLAPSVCAQLFGMKGLATVVGFGFLCHFPGQLLGGTISGLVLSSSGGNYSRVACYAGSCVLSAAFILSPTRFARKQKLFSKF